jgi:hypothetical protein
MDLIYLQEELFFSTVRISLQGDEDGSIGTGFLVKYRLPYDPDNFYTFLVSCRHVLENVEQNITLNFHKLDPDSEQARPALGQKISVVEPRFADAYFAHEDPDVDLACIQISGIMQMIRDRKTEFGEMFFLATEPSHFSDYTHPGLLPGLSVFYIGYPEDEYDELNNLPLMRVGHIASIPKVDYTGRPEIVIDGEVHPGSSGSPVFAFFPESAQLLGVLTSMRVASVAAEDLTGQSTIFTEQRIGLGYVVKISKLKELLDFAFRECESRLGRSAS